VKLTTHLHLVPRSKNEWSYTSTPQFAFMAWCLVNHSDSFAFLLCLIYLHSGLFQVCIVKARTVMLFQLINLSTYRTELQICIVNVIATVEFQTFISVLLQLRKKKDNILKLFYVYCHGKALEFLWRHRFVDKNVLKLFNVYCRRMG
jgi:hypothetical protein